MKVITLKFFSILIIFVFFLLYPLSLFSKTYGLTIENNTIVNFTDGELELPYINLDDGEYGIFDTDSGKEFLFYKNFYETPFKVKIDFNIEQLKEITKDITIKNENIVEIRESRNLWMYTSFVLTFVIIGTFTYYNY